MCGLCVCVCDVAARLTLIILKVVTPVLTLTGKLVLISVGVTNDVS